MKLGDLFTFEQFKLLNDDARWFIPASGDDEKQETQSLSESVDDFADYVEYLAKKYKKTKSELTELVEFAKKIKSKQTDLIEITKEGEFKQTELIKIANRLRYLNEEEASFLQKGLEYFDTEHVTPENFEEWQPAYSEQWEISNAIRKQEQKLKVFLVDQDDATPEADKELREYYQKIQSLCLRGLGMLPQESP